MVNRGEQIWLTALLWRPHVLTGIDRLRHTFDHSRHLRRVDHTMAKRMPQVPEFTVSGELIRGLVDCAAKCGLPRARFADLLAEGGAGPPRSRVAGHLVLKLWERVQRLSDDPVIGFRMALVAEPKAFGVLAQILPRCATVFDACRQAERYVALVSQGARLSVARTANTLEMWSEIAAEGTPVHAGIMLWGLTNLGLLPKRLSGRDARPEFIACAFAWPGAAAVRTLEQFCPFRFGASRSSVTFDRRIGDLRIPSADADLQALLTEVMERHLERLGAAGSFEQGLIAVLEEMANGTMPTLASVSSRVGMSARSLQRRLGEAHTSFQVLLQQALRQRADRLLASGRLTQAEIAFVLGYSEVSAFSRAYRRWTGHPPGAATA
jgi:AraC-like DNA-binding protein